jgi:hypothetical protein
MLPATSQMQIKTTMIHLLEWLRLKRLTKYWQRYRVTGMLIVLKETEHSTTLLEYIGHFLKVKYIPDHVISHSTPRYF